MQENQVTDVEFTEVNRDESAFKEETPLFNPVDFLTMALHQAGYPEPTAWYKGIDVRAETADSEKDRIFFANRALRLFLAEVENRENITPRMLLADGIDSPKWMALMEQGVIPWLMNQFDKKGKRVASDGGDTGVVIGIDPAAEGTTDKSAVIATNDPVIPEARLEDGQWVGESIAKFPEVQEQIRQGLEDGALQVQGSITAESHACEGEDACCGQCKNSEEPSA